VREFSVGKSDCGLEVVCELYICVLLYVEWR